MESISKPEELETRTEKFAARVLAGMGGGYTYAAKPMWGDKTLLCEFTVSYLGRLVGFPLESAVLMAVEWGHEGGTIMPTGMDEPTTAGVVLKPHRGISVDVPIKRARYINVSTGEPIRYKDMSTIELTTALRAGIARPEMRVCGTARAICYNLEDAINLGSKEATEYMQRLMFMGNEGVKLFLEDKAEGNLLDYVSNFVEQRYPRDTSSDYDGYAAYKEDMALVTNVTYLEILGYLMYHPWAGYSASVSESLAPKGVVEAYKDILHNSEPKLTKLSSEERYLIFLEAHAMAGLIAEELHSSKSGYATHNVKDNLDIIEDLGREAMVDRKLGELEANYLRTQAGGCKIREE